MESPLHSSPKVLPARLRRLASPLILAACLAGFAAGAGADVLVLRDGSRIETQGKWEQKGRQLVFKTSTGTLSAIRASEVDLAASEKATAEATAPKTPEVKAEAAKRPVLVLTDKDVRKAEPAEGAAPADGAPAGDPAATAAVAAAPAATGKVAVVSSRIDPSEGADSAFTIAGTVRNDSPMPVAEVGVLAVASASRDGVSRRVYCQATLPAPLAPKASANFTCQVARQDVLGTGMPDAFGDAALTFEVRATPQAPPADPKPTKN